MPNVLNEFAGDGVTQTFNFSMTGGYLSRDYVYFFTRPNDDLLNYTPYNDDAVTWLTDFSVRTANPIPVGTTFVILRSTTLNPLVDFQNTSRITEKNLDTATWQAVHIAAETSDTVGRIQVVATDAKRKSADAAWDAQLASYSAVHAAASATTASQSAGVAVSTANTAMSVATEAAAIANAAKDLVDESVAGAVLSFNGRAGVVMPQAGDYTKAMMNLGNVDNTSDREKPISTATSAALGLKADMSYVNTQLATKADATAMNTALVTNAAADRNRANHTGTQPYTTVSGLGSVVTKDHTVSQGDHGSKRVMLVGDFGIGASYDGRTKPIHGNLPPSGLYGKGTVFMFADGGGGSPASLSIPGLVPYSYGALTIHAQYVDASARHAIQRWFMYDGCMWQSSALNDTTWGPWFEYVNSESISRFTAGGRNQKWVLVSRALNVTYYNTTSAPIMVNISANATNATVEIYAVIGGTRIRVCGESSSASPRLAGNFIVPPGSSYLLESSQALGDIHELRQ